MRIEAADMRLRGAPAGRWANLLAYLLLEPGVPHARERLAEILWPDEPIERAGRTLTRALYRLRQSLGRGWLRADRMRVTLIANPGLTVDVWDFERLVAEGTTDSLARAVTIYTGELLPEVYDDWIAVRRASLADAYRTALATLAEAAEARGVLADAFRYYHWLTSADPLDEAAHRGLMRAYLRSGHPAAAIQQFERLSALLRKELSIEPSAETRRVGEAARREGAGGPETSDTPFIGRRRDRASVLNVLERRSTGPELILVEGEAGIGKSRLLDVLADDARWRGFHVIRGRCDESRTAAAYAPLDEALGTISQVVLDRARGRLAPAMLDAIASLLPAMAEHLPDTSAMPIGPLAAERPNVVGGLSALVGRLTEQRPLLITLDDVHHAGAAMWESLGFLTHPEAGRVVVVLAYRPAELRAHPLLWPALRQLDADVAPLRIELQGLTLAETRALGRALGSDASDEEVTELQQIAGGNPLVLQQALTAGPATRPGRPGFADLLDLRLQALSPGARRALEAAAVLGPTFTLAEWLDVIGNGPSRALNELVSARLVIERPEHYELEHELVRDHVYETISQRRRTLLHRRAAGVLARARAPSAVVAHHLERGGQAKRAAVEYARAASEAFTRYAYGEALEDTDRALALDRSVEGGTMALLTLRHRLLGLLLRLDEWRASLADAERLAARINDTSALIEVLEGRISLYTLDGDLDGMERAGQRALQLSRTAGDEQAEARLLATIGWHISESLGDNRRALPLLRRAVRQAERVGDGVTRVAALCSMSSALRSTGRSRAAHTCATRALAVVETRRQLYRGRAHVLAELAECVLELGRWQEAREAMQDALLGYRDVDDPWSYGSALYGLVNICGGMGQAAEAVAAGEELVALGVRLGLPPTSDYGAWHRVSLARAHLAAGEVAAADRVIEEVREARLQARRPRIAVGAMLGSLALERGDAAAAVDHLQPTFDLWSDTREPRDVLAPLLLAIAAARAGRTELAGRALSTALRALAMTDMERFDAWAGLARYEVAGDRRALDEARAAIARQAARFDDDELRSAFEHDVPLHRQIHERWQATRPTDRSMTVRLARSDVPLGRRVGDDERIDVVWSIGDGDASVDSESRVELRRRALVRLMAEAKAAGAAPTDAQLAATLGVSRRTILRDARALARRHQHLHTRRRRTRPDVAIVQDTASDLS